MHLQDRRGLEVSTRNNQSLDRFEHALELTASYFVDPLAEINAAIADDPGCAIAHCLRAGLAVMSSERGALPLIDESVAVVEARDSGANERERRHAAAARTWARGDFAGALQAYNDIVVDYPRDLLAVQISHVGDFFLGQSTMLRDRMAQVLPHWDASVPGFGYLLGMHAFGLEETALYERAEDTGRRALELNRRDPWAVHAVAHVMEMQGRLRDGIEWLTSRQDDWSVDNGLAYHNWWHLALHHLDFAEYERVLELYDTRIRPVQNPVQLEMLDASAMLWRLTLRGVDVGDRWKPLAETWAPVADEGFYAFNGVHATMALVASQQWDKVDATIASLEQAARGTGTNAIMSRDVGLPLARGIAAFGHGDYAAAIRHITPVRPHAHRLGGSHAQRDIVQLTLLEAALRAGNASLARALASERTDVKRTSPFNWRMLGRALDLQGRTDEARHAREQADVRAAAQQPKRESPRVAA
jgi:tetratricopeptide (TPR) repeat protein